MRPNKTLNHLKKVLRPGQVYRRSELVPLSSNISRHLVQLLAEGHLIKLSQGLYSVPKETVFGKAPPDGHEMIKTFLKDDHFVVYSPSQFNGLELGMTQLYNLMIVFNRKRVGVFKLGGRTYTFYRWREAPKELTTEFLVVELLHRLDMLAEDREQILAKLKTKIQQFDQRKLQYASQHYATLATQKRLSSLIAGAQAPT